MMPCPRARGAGEHDEDERGRERARPGVHQIRVADAGQHGETPGDRLLPARAARDDIEGRGCRGRNAGEPLTGLVDAIGRHHEHDMRGLAHAEHGIGGDREDRRRAERHERLRFGMPETSAAARGDDDDGDR